MPKFFLKSHIQCQQWQHSGKSLTLFYEAQGFEISCTRREKMAKCICHLNFTFNYSSGRRVVKLLAHFPHVKGLRLGTNTGTRREKWQNIFAT